MEGLRLELLKAKKELANKLKIPPGVQEQSPMEYNEIKQLEKKLKQLIKRGEKILKEDFTII